MADFSGVLNPKRVIERREAAAEGPQAAASAPAKGAMSQSDFGRGRKLTSEEEMIKQKKLAAKLRQHSNY